MRTKILSAVLTVACFALLFSRPASATDKAIIALQQSVSLLMNQVADLQKSFNTQIGMMQGLVQQNTDTVNKLSSVLSTIQQSISGSQVIAGQQQSDIAKQFQALSDTIAEVQAHLVKMDTTLQQIHQLQQTIPAPSATATTGGAPGLPGGTGTPDGTNPATNGATSVPPPAPNSPQQLYQNALSDFTAGNKAAQGELASFIRLYPNDPQVPDATYYLGSLFLQNQQYNEAIDRFTQVIEQYPENAKAPAAELNKGVALSKIGNRSAAIAEFRALRHNYPDTEAARSADIELKNLTGGRGRE
ncbi:MAG: tetratricopeptide repeat protein [Terriglobales bacterium]